MFRSTSFGEILILAGVILVSLPLLWSIRTNLLQARERDEWNKAFQQQSPVQTVQQNIYQVRRGWVPTKIMIEKLGLDAVVVQGRNANDLSRGPMHIPSTSGPGEGNCAIAAHKEKWFRRLHELRRGDKVILMTSNGHYNYVVIDRQIVTPYDIGVLDDSDYPVLTLITCTGKPYVHSEDRLVVTARLIKSRE